MVIDKIKVKGTFRYILECMGVVAMGYVGWIVVIIVIGFLLGLITGGFS